MTCCLLSSRPFYFKKAEHEVSKIASMLRDLVAASFSEQESQIGRREEAKRLILAFSDWKPNVSIPHFLELEWGAWRCTP